jgi:hypothetical protein
MPLPRAAAVLLAVVLAGGCGQPEPALTAQGDPLGPLEALPECEAPPSPSADAPEGLVLPDSAVVQQVTPQDPLVNVTAYVPMTPVQFEQAYAELDGIEILITENEVYEAELLISNGTHRNFFKAAATCSQGSAIIAVVAPEVDAEGLPVPAQATASPAP